MRRFYNILFLILFLVGCAPGQEVEVKKDIPLSAPELTLDGNFVRWTSIPEAISYELEIDGVGVLLTSDVLSYNVATKGYGTHGVRIKSLGKAGYIDSPYSASLSVVVSQYAPEPVIPMFIGDSLRPHPRLLFPEGHETKIREMIWTPEGKFLNIVHKEIEKYSDQVLNMEPFVRESLTSVNYAREVLGRIFYLSYMYRMTELQRYAARAERELLAVAAQYDEWRPDHFLTTSEMALAFAIGYDWLYDFLSEESRQIIVDAIVNKGLKASETASYRHSVGNWNSVCNACMIAASLAVYEYLPEKCSKYITEAIENNRKAVETFGPHGGYPEGYAYWHYGTVYQTMLFEMLKTSIGYDSILPDSSAGFDRTGAYAMMMTTPAGHCFSYADVAMGANTSSASFWLARHFNHPEWLYIDKKMMLAEGWTQEDKLWRFNPCILIYSVGLDIKSIDRPKFNTWYSDGNQPLFVYRSGFDDSNDVYLGVKGGYPKQGHSHMDSGAFYYERDGVIWSGDLGSDSYLLPGSNDSSQNGGRWDLFRCGLLSHSTIWFDDTEHIVTAKTHIKECFDDERIGVIVDLTDACANKVSYAERKVYLEEDELHVIDEIIPLSATTVTWNMLTASNAEITKESMIMLSQDGKGMALEVKSPEDAKLFVLPAEGGAGEATNPGYVRVGFMADLKALNKCELHVTLSPL